MNNSVLSPPAVTMQVRNWSLGRDSKMSSWTSMYKILTINNRKRQENNCRAIYGLRRCCTGMRYSSCQARQAVKAQAQCPAVTAWTLDTPQTTASIHTGFSCFRPWKLAPDSPMTSVGLPVAPSGCTGRQRWAFCRQVEKNTCRDLKKSQAKLSTSCDIICMRVPTSGVRSPGKII